MNYGSSVNLGGGYNHASNQYATQAHAAYEPQEMPAAGMPSARGGRTQAMLAEQRAGPP